MKLIISLISLFIIPFGVVDHESNIAYFKIEQIDSTIIIHAEFPWTIRNALLEFAPELKKSKSQKMFDMAYFDYLKSTLILKDNYGNRLKLLNVDAIKNGGHSHQNEFTLTYLGKEFKTLYNSILFNINSDQSNYHILKSESNLTFKTTPINSIFINESSVSKKISRSFIWMFVLLSIPTVLFKKRILKLFKI